MKAPKTHTGFRSVQRALAQTEDADIPKVKKALPMGKAAPMVKVKGLKPMKGCK